MNGETDKIKSLTVRDGSVVQKPGALAPGAAPGKLISTAAKRALYEADERRKAAEAAHHTHAPQEHSGPKGAEPTRFGDWERGGIAYDF